jgi:nucleotidyltransferase substrate binding protein (TIGR01987 family)
MSTLKLEPLAKAIIQLESGIKRKEQNPDDELLRDGVIQRFEYTMDLAWKFLQRYLKVDLQIDISVIRSKKDIFREAARLKLIDDAASWFEHYEARNSTSHEYDQETAKKVYAQALVFLPDVKKLIAVLKDAN